jgi:hypothetical protein
MTYARARLWLGISGVGSAVLAATAVLAFDVPATLLPTDPTQPLVSALGSALLPLLFAAVIFLPFDVLGGAIVVRARPTLGAFARRWLRGAAVQFVVWAVTAALLMTAARAGGTSAVIAAFVAMQLMLAMLRAPLARAIAAFEAQPLPARVREVAANVGLDPARIHVVQTSDEGFVGGWSGIAARRLVLPAQWLQLSDASLAAVLLRRRVIAESGAHRRGVIGAIAWNTLGFSVVLAASGANLATAAGLFTLAAGMTLWAFLGVLLLPTPSRAAVFAVDARSARAGNAEALSAAIEQLDQWQDDEARRSAGVETVFHPVPSRSARLERLRARATPRGASADAAEAASPATATHHLARHALWLGWGTLSPLSRLVHCNVGRPALWAMLPGD